MWLVVGWGYDDFVVRDGYCCDIVCEFGFLVDFCDWFFFVFCI